MKLSQKILISAICVAIISTAVNLNARSKQDLQETEIAEQVNTILNQVESRYSGAGFSADFVQKSTIKAMEITDTATGTLTVKRPNKMRWEYLSPDPQLIISNGTDLWVYRPEDKQVMLGKSPKFFGGGKGAGFLYV